jgi:hypothetical protein
MGICISSPTGGLTNTLPESCRNDYELVIRACKEIDVALLYLSKQAHHKIEHVNPGLHELITAAELDAPLEKILRYLATIRNSLVHDHSVDQLSDREAFISAFLRARAGLEAHRVAREQKRGSTDHKKGKGNIDFRHAEMPQRITVTAR